ncbi:MAG TPA: transglycosylase family protein [Acidimicrobiales bacterium]|nr:transglycosylase family protein [Acidimicrobiales bacterium]
MIVGIALHQSKTSQSAAGSSASILGSRLAADSLTGTNPGLSPVSGAAAGPMGGLDIALTSLHVPVAAAPVAAVTPATTAPTGPPTTAAPTTTTAPPPTTTTTAAPTPPATTPAASYVSASGNWAALRECESGNNYSENSGNGYYGAYQFSEQTWQGLGYSGLPSDAAPSVQDQAAQQLQAQSGWGQWPACSAELGLT